MTPKVLHLTLLRKWFDLIASGEKTEEYRLLKPHWKTRLEGKIYDEIHFRNGYNKDAPSMRVEFIGVSTGDWEGQPCYVIRLGRIISLYYPKNGVATDPSFTSPDAETKPAISNAGPDGQSQGIDPT